MMEAMRSLASGFVAKILIGLLVLSFAVWGIADIFSNFGRSAVATVGNTEIDVRDYQSELFLEVNALSNQIGQRLTTAQSASFGLPNQVLGRMINEATLNDMATDFNMGISDTELAKSIAREPAFQFGGRFDRNQMNLVLRNAGTTEDRYVEGRKALEQRRQLAAGLTGKSTIPQAAIKIFNNFTREKRDINYIALKEDALGEIEAPTDAELTTYFDANKSAFRAPEYRSFEFLKLEPGDILDPEAVSDEDAQIYYETAQNRFVEPEKRQMQQILFGSKEEAQAAADKIAGGATFDDIITERELKLEDVDFGLLSKEEITDPAAAEAIFSLGEGQVSEVVEGRFGHLLLRTVKIQPSESSPFEDVKEQLKAEIAAERATGEVLNMFDKVEDERAGGSTLKEIADKLSLPLRTVTGISNAGALETGEEVTDLPAQTDLLASVFETEVDFEADPVDINNTGFAWFQVSDIIPARDRTIDEVREDVIAAWTKAERTKRNADLAAELLKEAKDGGKSLEALALERDLLVEAVTDISRQNSGTLPAAVVQEAFNGPKGFQSIAVTGETQYVLEVGEVVEAEFNSDDAQITALRQSLNNNVSADLLNQMSAEVLRTIGYTINEPLMQQVINGAN